MKAMRLFTRTVQRALESGLLKSDVAGLMVPQPSEEESKTDILNKDICGRYFRVDDGSGTNDSVYSAECKLPKGHEGAHDVKTDSSLEAKALSDLDDRIIRMLKVNHSVRIMEYCKEYQVQLINLLGTRVALENGPWPLSALIELAKNHGGK